MTATKLKTKAKAKAPTETRRLGYARASTYGQKIDAQLASCARKGAPGFTARRWAVCDPTGANC